MYTYTWYQWLTFFYLYCFFGWIFESTYVSLKQKRFVNRGFLRLPMLPLYGSGAVMGISPVSGQPDPHLYLRRYRCHGSGVRDWICDGAAFQSPLLGLQQPAL